MGFALHEVRNLAAIVASTIAALLLIEYFGRKLKKPKWSNVVRLKNRQSLRGVAVFSQSRISPDAGFLLLS